MPSGARSSPLGRSSWKSSNRTLAVNAREVATYTCLGELELYRTCRRSEVAFDVYLAEKPFEMASQGQSAPVQLLFTLQFTLGALCAGGDGAMLPQPGCGHGCESLPSQFQQRGFL